jgi:L-2-amino-thiazoline-4-carboxylic acid hydrolase
MSDHMTQTLPMLEKRRIEAEILKHVYETALEKHGKHAALDIVREAVKRSAIEQGERLAAEVGGKTSLQTFIDLQPRWTADNALEIEVLAKDEQAFDFNVTRCRYAEMYREMGLGEIGHLLSCNRDGTFCEGYDKSLDLARTQTLMQGASHCDFRYRYRKDPA